MEPHLSLPIAAVVPTARAILLARTHARTRQPNPDHILRHWSQNAATRGVPIGTFCEQHGDSSHLLEVVMGAETRTFPNIKGSRNPSGREPIALNPTARQLEPIKSPKASR